MKTKNQMISKALIIAVMAACFSLNVKAENGHMSADTGKMSKMKMEKKMSKKKMSKMKKDTASKM